MVGLGRRLIGVFVLLCLIVPIVSNTQVADARRNEAASAPALDIAAIALRPSDLDVEGFVIGGGIMYTLEDYAADGDVTVDELRADGHGRTYFESVGLAADGDSDCFGQVISTWVYEMADRNAAEAMITEEIGMADEFGWSVIDDNVAIGGGGALFDAPMPSCEAVGGGQGLHTLTQRSGDDEGDGILAAFVVGNLAIHVWLFNNADAAAVPADAYQVDEETVLELADIATEKAEDAFEGELGAELEPMVLRIGDGETYYGSEADDYVRFDGVDFAFDGESRRDIRIRTERYGDATDVYQLTQTFDDADGDLVVFTNNIYQFEDEDAAADWMAQAEERLLDNPRYDDVEQIELDGAYGDESVAFMHEDVELETKIVRGYARYGSRVVAMAVGAESGVDVDVLEELMIEQETCAEDQACAGAIPFPGR